MPSRKLPAQRGAVVGRLFVDSGAWIALRNRRDQYHALADRLFRTAIRDRRLLVTTNLVIAESYRLTLFRVGVLAAVRALDRIDASERVTLHFATEADHIAARRWIERLAPRPISYTDAISFAVMETIGCRDVLGFDRDFEAAGFTLWRD